jgi:hypothetical protein
MAIDERFLTLLTPEGEFLKAHKLKPDYLIGEEIVFSPILESKKNTFFRNRVIGKPLVAAACALIVGAASFIPLLNDNNVYAYMSIDVNPSIELAVNDELEVVDLEAYNPEGERVLSAIKGWKHEEVEKVTTTIIDEIRKQGYFDQNDKILISTVYDEQEKLKVKQKLEANLVKIEEKIANDHVEVTVVKASKEDRVAAHKKGITTGEFKEKQKVLNETKKQTGSATVDETILPNKSDSPNKEDKAKEEMTDKKENKGKTSAPGQEKKKNEVNTGQKDKQEKGKKNDKQKQKEMNSEQKETNRKENKNENKQKNKENKEKNKENKPKKQENKQKKNDQQKEKKQNNKEDKK